MSLLLTQVTDLLKNEDDQFRYFLGELALALRRTKFPRVPRYPRRFTHLHFQTFRVIS